MKRLGKFTFFLFIALCSHSLIAHGQDYGSLQMIGESCRASFAANSSGQAMVDQTFVLSSEPVEMIASNELSNWIKDSRKDYSAYLLNQRDLANRSTQIYLNQTLYNWMVFEKIFGNTSGPQIRPDVLNQPSTQSGLKTVLPIFETQKANLKSLQTKQALENEIEWINPIIMDLNKVCRKRHATYQVLNQAYRNKSMQNPQFNPQLQSILLPDGQPTVLSYNGDTDSLIHKRMQEERNSATHEASFYRYILSQSSFGYLLNTQTDLQNFVGNWNVRSCVEEGQELKTISLQAMTYISSSIEQVRKTYQSTVRRLSTIQQPKIIGEVVIQKTSQEIIEQFIQENPTSIQAAMLIHPNEQQALMVCSAIKNIQNTQDIQEAAIPLIVVGATVASAFVGPEAMLLINGAWLTSSASDVVQSYGMEKRINQAILSDQISVLFGQEIIRNIQSQRPLSYLNLALAGTGSAASIKSIQQKVKVRAYDEQLSVHGGSTQAKFNKVQTTKTISESKTTVEAAPGKQITLQEKAAIESWFKKQPNTSKGVVENGKTKTQNDLDLFNHDPDGNFGTIVQPKTPIPGGSKTIQNLLQDTGVTMHGKLGFIQPRMQGLSINRPSNSFEIQNQIRLDPISELSTFPMSVLNVQTVRSTIGSEEQLDDISQLKDLLDDLLSRDSDDLTKDEIDVLCNLLKNGIDPWLKILLDLVLDKYAAKLDCENMTKLMYVEKRSESFTPKVVVEYDHFKNINPLKLPIPFHYYSEAMQQLYEPRPIVLNQAETGVTESEPTAIPETKPDEEKPMPSLTPKQDGENQEQVPPGQANPPKLSSDKISMIPNRSLPPIPYAIPNGYVSYQSDVWMGDHISEEKLKEIQEAVEQFYKNQNGKSLFQRAMSWDMSLEVRAEMKRLDALCASDKENERPPRAICQFVAEYLRGNRGKQMLLFQDNGFNFSSNFDNQIAEIGLPMNLLNELKSMYPELSKQWENLINLHASSYFTDKNSAQKIHRLLYSLAETNKLSNQAQKYEYFHQVLKTGGTNVSSPLDVEIYKESQRTHTDLPVILDREQIKNIMEMLRKKPVRLNQDDRVVEYNLTEQNFIEEKVIFKNISINHEFVKMSTVYEPSWQDLKLSIDGFIYLPAILHVNADLAYPAILVLLNPKYNEKEAIEYFENTDLFTSQQIDKMHDFIFETSLALFRKNSSISLEEYRQSLWESFYASHDAKGHIDFQIKRDNKKNTLVFHDNQDGLEENLNRLHVDKNMKKHIFSFLNKENFFNNYFQLQIKLEKEITSILNDKIPGPIGKFYADQLKIWLKSESIESKAKLLFLEVLKDKRESDDVLMFLKKIAITRMSFESYDLFYRFLYSRGEMEVTQSEKLTLSKLFKIYKNNMEPVNLKETNFIEYQFNNEVNPPFNNLQELVTLQISQFQKNGVKDVVKYDEARKIGGEIWIPTYDLYNNFSSYFVLNLEDPFHIRRAIYPTLNDFANFSGVKDSIQTLFYYRFSESLYETQGIPIKINLETLNDFASKSSEFNFMKNDLSVASHSTLEKLLHQYFKHYHQQRSLIVYSDPSIFGVHPDHFRNAVESEFQQTFVTTSYVEAYENLDGQKTTKFLDQIGKKSVFILNTTKSIPIQKELHTQWIILKNSSFVISDYYFDDENKIEYFFFNENK